MGIPRIILWGEVVGMGPHDMYVRRGFHPYVIYVCFVSFGKRGVHICNVTLVMSGLEVGVMFPCGNEVDMTWVAMTTWMPCGRSDDVVRLNRSNFNRLYLLIHELD